MPRYIDADVLPKLFDEEYVKIRKFIENGETHLDNLAEGFTEAVRVVKFVAPTADVVEVVRCRDCKYSKTIDVRNEFRTRFMFCHRREHYSESVNDNDFCSYGERRKNDGQRNAD